MKAGMKEGMKVGMKKEQLRMARRLREMGMDTSFIVQATGLKPEDLASL